MWALQCREVTLEEESFRRAFICASSGEVSEVLCCILNNLYCHVSAQNRRLLMSVVGSAGRGDRRVVMRVEGYS